MNNTPVTYLKGVGPARARLLAAELDIHTVGDLLRHYPSHYVDRSTTWPIASFAGDMPAVQVRGRFVNFTVHGEGARMRLVGLFTDGTATMEVVWFRKIKTLREAYTPGKEYILFGKPQVFGHSWSMAHPEVDAVTTPKPGEEPKGDSQGLRGVYPLTEKLRNASISSRSFHQWTQTALRQWGPRIADTLPPYLREKYRLVTLAEALAAVHNPPDNSALQRGRDRLKFEELFYLQLNIQRYSLARRAEVVGTRMPRVGQMFNGFYSQTMPFPLTGAQKRVMHEIRADLVSGRQMNRLLQGDVGSGKTVVALMTMLIAVDNGYQACIMAPTEILARQHYESLRSLAAPVGVNIRCLTGSTPAAERREIDRQLLDGSLHILVGTHAVIEDRVTFRNLGLVVIDEQHRFGVLQRARLWGKAKTPPHILVMTATPIPRTLAMTVYGDLDVSVINELPPGRKPITTLLRTADRRMEVLRHAGREIARGRQVYIVYPLIDDNPKMALQSLSEGRDFISEAFPSCRVAWVHGRMTPAEKDYQMQLFVSGQAQILVATTVIEVGVNVPNASVMIIENAERFGLSQLHQLRGRVGRGAEQSYCILMTRQNIGGDTRRRLELMTATTDGFRIAEEDLRMRGPGDLEGTQQSGLPIKLSIASLATDGPLVATTRDEAITLLEADPRLAAPANAIVADTLRRLFPRPADLSRIS